MPSSASASSMFSTMTARRRRRPRPAASRAGGRSLLADPERARGFVGDLRPSSTASFTTRSGGTTRLTSPSDWPPPRRPSRRAAASPWRPCATRCGSAPPSGVEQNSPILTPGVAKRASWLATARSQLATSWQPAAVAMPFTARSPASANARSRASSPSRRPWLREERGPVLVVAVRRQLLEVVARGERAADTGNDDGAGRIGRADRFMAPSAPRSAPPTGSCAPPAD